MPGRCIAVGARDRSCTHCFLLLVAGVESLNNVFLIGMTNRLDMIDEALLRPGRFELKLQIGLPDEPGRLEIFVIHTKKLFDNKFVTLLPRWSHHAMLLRLPVNNPTKANGR